MTRGSSGREIYNALLENFTSKGSSPLGTEWVIGDTADISALSFLPFRTDVGIPKDVVGKKLVLHIKRENRYPFVEFPSWGSK